MLAQSSTFHSHGEGDHTISLSEVLSALTFALDLTEGAIPGHALRSCLLGMRLAVAMKLPAAQMGSLYYALLLKDVGCSSNSARMCQIVGGDDRAVKAGAKLEDWTKPHKASLATLGMLWSNVLPESGPITRAIRIAKMGLTQHANNKELITLRCDRGASIVRKVGLGELAADGVRYLDEHWDGSGYPHRLEGEQIPLISRICAVAQHMDAFSTERGAETAMQVLFERAGTWFDPELVRATGTLVRTEPFWSHALATCDVEETRRAVLDLDVEGVDRLPADRIDEICEAFSQVVDAKSPFTFRHSMGVEAAAGTIARELGLSDARIQLVRRVALLHDLGKLGVSNTILDKPGRLTPEERAVVEVHPGKTRDILARIGAFREVAAIAGEHHEKLDGSGYPDGRVQDDLSLESRIIAVADIYGALSEDRPYRKGLEFEQIKSIMEKDAPHKIDPVCLEALLAVIERSHPLVERVSMGVVRPQVSAGPPSEKAAMLAC